MQTIKLNHRSSNALPFMALLIALGVMIGWALPTPDLSYTAPPPVLEDWHGNVKRSTYR